MKTLRKSVSILLTMLMLIGIFALPASAGDIVAYNLRSWNSNDQCVEEQYALCYDSIDLSERTSNNLVSGWYVVEQSLTISSRLYVGNNTVNLILCDETTLTVNEGISISKNGTLNIYGQGDDTGKIYAHYELDPESEAIHKAIIGSDSGDTGTIRIYGGSLDIETGSTINCYNGAAIGGGNGGSPAKIEIYGGNVKCRTKGYGAAIGGGNGGKTSWNQSGGTGTAAGIVIYGGDVYTKGDYGAAIGSGAYCSGDDNSAIAIFGGDIAAIESALAAGIGGGEYSSNGPIDIYGGNINASGVNSRYTGAGIGSGRSANQTKPIRIHGGTIVATGGSSAGIGAGYQGNAGTISISGASVVASSTAGGAGIGGGKKDGTGGHGGNITITDSTVVATSSEYAEAQAFKDTINRCIGNSKMKTDATAYADSCVSLVAILVDLFDDNNSGTGIGAGADGDVGTITITDSDIIAESGKYAAAIGSGQEGEVNTINISGCTVSATSGEYAAAIGTGDESDSGCTINITNGSEVVATAGTDAAGIGTGNNIDGTATINIADSTVTAHGGRYGAGIGGGDDTDGGNITIDHSTVTADSKTDGAGIGGGESGAGGTILITNSSTVTATGGGYAAGIGGGDNGDAGNITISGHSNVTATAGEDGAGIGGGEDGDGGTVSITDSTVTATGKHYGAGIGCGEDGDSATVKIYSDSIVEATAGGSGYATALGNGDYVVNAPDVWSYLDNGLIVYAGSNASSAQRYTGQQRYNAVWSCKYAKIQGCDHPNVKWCYDNSVNHIRKCMECNYRIGETEPHVWNEDNVCTICGSAAVMCTLRLVEKNTAGAEVVTEIAVPKYTEYALPACTNKPANSEFLGWMDDYGTYAPGTMYQVTDNTLEAVYTTLTEAEYIDAKGVLRTVQARQLSTDVTYLPDGWYVADTNLDYAELGKNITISGTVNLIIADGVEITLNNRGGNSLRAQSILTTLYLYGQTGQSGVLRGDNGTLHLSGLTQYGAAILSDSRVSTIETTLARGRLQANYFGASSGFTITGGNFAANSVTSATPNTISWTEMTDSIKFEQLTLIAGKGSLIVAEDKAFTDGTNVYTGTLTDEQIAALQGQTLIPYILHHYGEPEWEWSDDYEHAAAVFRCTDDGCTASVREEADIEKVSEQTPSCTQSGEIVWEASVSFESESYTDRQTQSFPKTKDMTHHARVEPTKTTEGTIEYYSCNECGKYFIYDTQTKEYVEINPAQIVIAKLPSTNGYSLTLGDTIQVNFLIDAAYYDAQDGYIVYEYVKSIHEESAERVLSEEISINSLDTYADGGAYDGNAILTLSAAPAQMAESYTIYLYNKAGELQNTMTASVANYCQRMCEDATYGELMSALLNYGQLANEYFHYAALVEGEYEVPHTQDYLAELSAAETATLDAAAISTLNTQGAAQIQGVSYIAQINPEFKFYFKNAVSRDGTVSGDLSAATDTEGSNTVVHVSGLKASEFAKPFTVCLDGTEIAYNGYAYIKTALKNPKVKALAQGIFRYAQAAEKVFN